MFMSSPVPIINLEVQRLNGLRIKHHRPNSHVDKMVTIYHLHQKHFAFLIGWTKPKKHFTICRFQVLDPGSVDADAWSHDKLTYHYQMSIRISDVDKYNDTRWPIPNHVVTWF
jgi:hypothetical protein